MKRLAVKTPLVDSASTRSSDLSKNTYKGKNLNIEIPRGADNKKNANGDTIAAGKEAGKKSVFNSFHVFKNSENIYTDEDFSENRNLLNPSIENLLTVKSKGNRYEENDFLYLKKLDELPNNRLITLRRFAYPVHDDIFSSFQQEPDICRLLTYFDQESNQLESLFNMTFGMKWKELNSASEQAQTVGDQNGADGFQKKILKFIDPKFGQEKLQGENALNYDPQHDSNKVYGPVDSIASTHIRDVGLEFTHSVKLQFEFELRSINGINPKAAFLDLLSNILALTTNDAKFWGGARHWIGPKPSTYARDLRKLSNQEYIKYTNRTNQDMKSYVANVAKNIFSLENIQNVAQNLKNLAFGEILDKLGRPTIPVMNSLLTGEPVGEWHMTIGNPLRPIMSCGNLILKNSTLTVPHGALGNDDFPTGLILECELEHAMPRGRAEIESMFNSGKGRMYFKPTKEDLHQILKGGRKPKSLEGFAASAIDDAIKNLYGFPQRLG